MSLMAGVDGVAGLKERLDAVKGVLITGDSLGRVSDAGVEMVLKRTGEGRGFAGDEFERYSAEYKKVRERKGRSADRVDLRSSGRMLDDIKAEVSVVEKRSEIFFGATESLDKAYRHQVSGVGKDKVVRKFFGLTEEDKSGLAGIFSAHVDSVLKEKL